MRKLYAGLAAAALVGLVAGPLVYTRFQGDADIITIPGVRCHPLDPSNDPTCSPSIRDHGIACKTIFDCTVPYDQKERFVRARFMEVDPKHWLDEE